MGNPGNIALHYEDEQKIFLYTHWTGSYLPSIVKEALVVGKSRWNDPQYLSRIMFSTLTKHEKPTDTTGYGISPYMGDGGVEVEVDLINNKVSLDNSHWVSFQEYVDSPDEHVVD